MIVEIDVLAYAVAHRAASARPLKLVSQGHAVFARRSWAANGKVRLGWRAPTSLDP